MSVKSKEMLCTVPIFMVLSGIAILIAQPRHSDLSNNCKEELPTSMFSLNHFEKCIWLQKTYMF